MCDAAGREREENTVMLFAAQLRIVIESEIFLYGQPRNAAALMAQP